MLNQNVVANASQETEDGYESVSELAQPKLLC